MTTPIALIPSGADPERPADRSDADSPVARVETTLVPPARPHPRHCTRILENGTRCKRYAIIGGFVCSNHGGSVPATIEAAKKRLAFLVDPAIEVLFDLATSPLTEDDVRLRAANSILSRIGLGEHQKHEVTARTSRDPSLIDINKLSDEELSAKLDTVKVNLLESRASERWRTEKLDECQSALDAQERLGVPDRAHYDQLIKLRDSLIEVNG